MEKEPTWNPLAQNKYLKMLVVIALATLVFVVMWRRDSIQILGFIHDHGRLGIGVSLIIYALLGATPIPSEPFTVFLATLYGPLVAVGVATVGNTFAALVEFLIGASIGDIAEFEKRRAKLPFRLGEIPINSPVFLFLGRMLPGFGPKFMSLACGIYKVPWLTYAWIALLSNFLGAVLVAYGGYSLLKLLK